MITSPQPYEDRYGYSRAVVAGKHVFVSGTVSLMPDGGDPPPDVYGQARRIFEIIVAALAEAGAGPEDVVRTRIFVTRPEDFDAAGRAHKEVLGETKPASTGVVVSMIEPRWLVEIEADALLP